MTSVVISSRLVSLKISCRARGRPGWSGQTRPRPGIAGRGVDQLAVARERVGLAGDDQDRQVGTDGGQHLRVGEPAACWNICGCIRGHVEAAERAGDVGVDLGLSRRREPTSYPVRWTNQPWPRDRRVPGLCEAMASTSSAVEPDSTTPAYCAEWLEQHRLRGEGPHRVGDEEEWQTVAGDGGAVRRDVVDEPRRTRATRSRRDGRERSPSGRGRGGRWHGPRSQPRSGPREAVVAGAVLGGPCAICTTPIGSPTVSVSRSTASLLEPDGDRNVDSANVMAHRGIADDPEYPVRPTCGARGVARFCGHQVHTDSVKVGRASPGCLCLASVGGKGMARVLAQRGWSGSASSSRRPRTGRSSRRSDVRAPGPSHRRDRRGAKRHFKPS